MPTIIADMEVKALVRELQSVRDGLDAMMQTADDLGDEDTSCLLSNIDGLIDEAQDRLEKLAKN